MQFNGEKTKSTKINNFIFLIKSNNNSQKIGSVELKGKNSYNNYKRDLLLLSKEQLQNYTATNNIIVLPNYGKSTFSNYNFSAVIPYQEWMQGASLVIVNDLCGCGNILSSQSYILCDQLSYNGEHLAPKEIIQNRVIYNLNDNTQDKFIFSNFYAASKIYYKKYYEHLTRLNKL